MTDRKLKPGTTIHKVRPAGGDHVVTSASAPQGRAYKYRRKPCSECPWRKDLKTGVFPAQAFRHSAPTSYDQAETDFACHVSGVQNLTTCAGFILRAPHSLNIRKQRAFGRFHDDVESPYPLYDDYRAMAIANGVSPDDPVLRPCR